MTLYGFVDSDWGGSDDMRSTSGYIFSLGSGFFCWNSKKQDVVAQSTAEAEYVAATTAVNQALWLRKLLVDLKHEQQEATEIFVDNEAAITISNNPLFHGRTIISRSSAIFFVKFRKMERLFWFIAAQKINLLIFLQRPCQKEDLRN